MQNVKKILALVIAVVMLVGMMTGCKSNNSKNTDNGSNTPTNAPSASESTKAPESSEPKEVTTVTVWTGNQSDKQFMMEQVNAWNDTVGKEKSIKIEYEVKDNVSEMIDLALLSGQAPDIFTISDVEKLATEGYIAALEDLPGGPELIEKYKDTLSPFKQTYNGKTYNLTGGVNVYGLLYNKDMFKAAGLVDENGEAKPPETFEELREYAKILTNPSKNEYGIIFPGKFSAWYDEDIRRLSSASTGILQWDPATGKYNYDGHAQTMQLLMGIKADGSYFPGVEGMDNDPARARFAEGGIGMKTGVSYDFGVLTDQFPAKIDWGVAPYPTADKDVKYKQAMGFGRYLAINKIAGETKDINAIMEVYKWFHSDELVIAKYVGGYALPYNYDLVRDIELDPSLKQWGEFAALLDVSYVSRQEKVPVALPEGERAIGTVWLEDIWSGKVSVDEIASICDNFETIYNNATQSYYEAHPNVDIGQFIDLDWFDKVER